MRTIRFLNSDTPEGVFEVGDPGVLYWVVGARQKYAVQLADSRQAPAFTAFALGERSIAFGEWLFPAAIIPEAFDSELWAELMECQCDLGEDDLYPGDIAHFDGISKIKVLSEDEEEFFIEVPAFDRLLAGDYDFTGFHDRWTLHGGEFIREVFTRCPWEQRYARLCWEKRTYAGPARRKGGTS